MVRTMNRLPVAACLALVTMPFVTACGPLKTMAINSVANTLAKSGTSATSDPDPELIEAAFPYQIKLQEGLLESVPHNRDLLVSTCSLSTEFGYAFLQGKAEMLGEAHHDEVVALKDRALKMYLRGKGYCTRALDERFKKISVDLVKDDATMQRAVKRFDNKKKDVPMLYWTAASWGAAIALAKDRPEIAIDFPVVRALADRALELDESWNKGAIHELMITLDSLPAMLGGSPERAKKDFDRAVELQGGRQPGPYIAYAMGIDTQDPQNKADFIEKMNKALAIDPDREPSTRLVTIIMQRKAKALLDQVDTIFTSPQPFVHQ